MRSLLIEESPLVILPTLAVKIGLNEAVVLQQVFWWTKTDEWVTKSVIEWRNQFPFWSEKTIWRTLASLESAGLIEVEQSGGTDRSKSYRLNEPELELQGIWTNWPNGSGQVVQMHSDNLSTSNLIRKKSTKTLSSVVASLATSEDETHEDATTPKAPRLRSDVADVWDHFVYRFVWGGNTVPKAKIEARLKKFSVEQLKLAIDHVRDDYWLWTNQRHNALDFLFRSDASTTKYLELRPRKTESVPSNGQFERTREYRDIE